MISRYNAIYDETYYQRHCGPVAYGDRDVWEQFASRIADFIVSTWKPNTFIDVGCAFGYLVAALRDRGVDAWGIDISEYAISQVREDIRPYCTVFNAVNGLPSHFPSHFDGLSTIEVIEHLGKEEMNVFLDQICKLSDLIIFSSTGEDFDEPTHQNVQQMEYWVKQFTSRGYVNAVELDLSIISPFARVFERKPIDMIQMIEKYERHLRITRSKLAAAQSEISDLQNKFEEGQQEIAQLEKQAEKQLAIQKTIESDQYILKQEHQAQLKAAHSELEQEIARLRNELSVLAHSYSSISQSKFWKLTKPFRKIADILRKIKRRIYRIAGRSIAITMNQTSIGPRYDWNKIGSDILTEQQSEMSAEEIIDQISKFSQKPLISVIMPVYNPPVQWLKKAVESLQNQYYDNWELCAADDGSPDPAGYNYLSQKMLNDNRIKVIKMPKNGGISYASNGSLEAAHGEYVALLDQDDEITPDAFFWIVKKLNEEPETDFIYTDECKIGTNSSGPFFDFYFKPDWSPRLLMNHMYTGHLTVYRTDLVKETGGFRSKFDFSQDYDLALRMGDRAKHIVHIERVLYFWRAIETSAATGAKDFARVGNMHALKDWYNRHDFDVVMEKLPRGNYGRVLTNNPMKVSVIIPTDNYKNLQTSLHGLMEKTSYRNIEFIPVTNSKIADTIKREYTYLEDKLKLCRYDRPYNFSDKCNEGALLASGDVLVFYNDDVEPITVDWIDKLLDQIVLPDVGSVSPMLIHEDGTIQYAGMTSGTPGLVGTCFNNYMADDYVYSVYNHVLLRDVTVLSGACFAIRRELFSQIGGFDAINTPAGHSDVDLSFKLLELGKFNVYTPHAKLVHIGSHTWHETVKKDKADIFCLKKWCRFLDRDPLYTDSIKKMFYHDFPYKFKIYAPSNQLRINGNGQDVLFITHELSRTGAPTVMIDAVKNTLNSGGFPVVLSYEDGPLREYYQSIGVVVIIDESIRNQHWMFERFARNFDIIFVNTMACYQAIKLLEKTNVPIDIYWWLHEGSFAIEMYRHLIPAHLPDNVHVLCAGRYVSDMLKKYHINYPNQILQFGVEDFAASALSQPVVSDHSIKTFLFIGSFEKRKGVDILLHAIELLPDAVQKECKFMLIGSPMYPDVYKAALEFSEQHSNVSVRNVVPRDEVFKLYEQVFGVIVPSRDEPTSAVAVEAMMFSKPVICSDHTGVSYFVKDSENGFIFKNENALQLSQRIADAVNDPDKFARIGVNGRKVYEDIFSMNIFNNKYSEIIMKGSRS